jgi:hypothetical protein
MPKIVVVGQPFFTQFLLAKAARFRAMLLRAQRIMTSG